MLAREGHVDLIYTRGPPYPLPHVALPRATNPLPPLPPFTAAGDSRWVPRMAADEGGGEALNRDANPARI